MQFKLEGKQKPISCLDDYSEDQIELMNSRHRLNCEASERSSRLQQQNEDEINQFKRQIEERFKLSIANKIYTFPKVINSISDLISSSEDEDSSNGSYFKMKKSSGQESGNFKNFKKKSVSKYQKIKIKLNDSSIRYYESGGKGIESSKKGKEKLKTNDSTYKRKEKDQQTKEKNHLKINKKINAKNENKKGERLKTEPQSSVSFLQTIRSKVGKKY